MKTHEERKAYALAYYYRTREHQLKLKKKRDKKNRKRNAAYYKKWFKENPEYVKDYCKEYHKENYVPTGRVLLTEAEKKDRKKKYNDDSSEYRVAYYKERRKDPEYRDKWKKYYQEYNRKRKNKEL